MLVEEIQNLLQKRALVVAASSQKQFISRLFLVSKKDGTSQPVINLKRFIQKSHFKIEGTRMIKDVLQAGDWISFLDLKDAYLSVPITKDHRKYLRFIWDLRVHLPAFGLCSAPHTFTKLL